MADEEEREEGGEPHVLDEFVCGVVSGLKALTFCGDVNCCAFLGAQHRESVLPPGPGPWSKSCAVSLPGLHRGSGGVVDTNLPPLLPTYSTTLELLFGLCRTREVAIVWERELEVELTERMEAEEERRVVEMGEEVL
uniref:Uncharacterized protein n=1 Tax=Cacopsylla melanoneura TaxID=428564 RepID=A0A8D8PYF6_9HEMI